MKENKPNLQIKSEQRSQNEEAGLKNFADRDQNRNKGELFFPWRNLQSCAVRPLQGSADCYFVALLFCCLLKNCTIQAKHKV